jgi:hypothetical protein
LSLGVGLKLVGWRAVGFLEPATNQNVVFQSGRTGGLDIGMLGSAYTDSVAGKASPGRAERAASCSTTGLGPRSSSVGLRPTVASMLAK